MGFLGLMGLEIRRCQGWGGGFTRYIRRWCSGLQAQDKFQICALANSFFGLRWIATQNPKPKL